MVMVMDGLWIDVRTTSGRAAFTLWTNDRAGFRQTRRGKFAVVAPRVAVDPLRHLTARGPVQLKEHRRGTSAVEQIEMQAELVVTPAVLDQLAAFRARPKFGPDDSRFLPYVGYLPETSRADAEQELNAVVDALIEGLPSQPTAAFVLSCFAKGLLWFAISDTEDRERCCDYLVEIMDIVGMESSDGLLNRFMYGDDVF
jgi:hypothetical protein